MGETVKITACEEMPDMGVEVAFAGFFNPGNPKVTIELRRSSPRERLEPSLARRLALAVLLDGDADAVWPLVDLLLEQRGY